MISPRIFRILILLGGILLPAHGQAKTYSMEDYDSVDKIDIHVHIHTVNTDFVESAKRDRFRFVNIATQTTDDARVMEERMRTTLLQHRRNPDRVAAVSSFPMAGWDKPDWQEKTIAYLDETIAKGAVGIKLWKNIGMVDRDKDGKYVMIDDPQFEPIFKHLKQRGIRVLGHLGEPKNCWLPLDEMTVNSDRNYFRKNSQYHMYLHPEMSSYQEQIDARDRMLAKHPDMPFIACHLASLEWSVEELSRFFDQFPNANAGMAQRICHFQYQSQQNRSKVIDFLIKYQDRLLYSTDAFVGPDDDTKLKYEEAHKIWLSDWAYFNTSEMISVPELSEPVQGLALPREVVDKIYRINAMKEFPNSWGNEP